MKSHWIRVLLVLLGRRLLLGLLAGWIGVLASPACWAEGIDPDSHASALALGKMGATAYESAQYAEAITSFDRAFALLPAPSLRLWAARSAVKLGWLVEAQQRYREIAGLSDQIGDPAIQRKAQREAQAELAELSARIAVSERREQVVESTAPASQERVSASFNAASVPERTPASSARAWRTAGWVGVGAGGAVLLTGLITRTVAQGRYDSLQRQPGCTRTECPPETRDRIDSYHAMRSLSLLTTISGAVLATAGAGVLLFVSKDEQPAGLASTWTLSPGGITWSGRF